MGDEAGNWAKRGWNLIFKKLDFQFRERILNFIERLENNKGDVSQNKKTKNYFDSWVIRAKAHDKGQEKQNKKDLWRNLRNSPKQK